MFLPFDPVVIFLSTTERSADLVSRKHHTADSEPDTWNSSGDDGCEVSVTSTPVSAVISGISGNTDRVIPVLVTWDEIGILPLSISIR